MCWMISPSLAACHNGTDRGCEVAKRQGFTKHLVKLFSGPPQILCHISDLTQEINGLTTPEKMGHHDRINVWIGCGTSCDTKNDATSRPSLCLYHSTPLRGAGCNSWDMLGGRNYCELLQCLSINANLGGQPIERILGTLDFVTMDATVNHRYIYATLRMSKA
jgi:hypothetical protein